MEPSKKPERRRVKLPNSPSTSEKKAESITIRPKIIFDIEPVKAKSTTQAPIERRVIRIPSAPTDLVKKVESKPRRRKVQTLKRSNKLAEKVFLRKVPKFKFTIAPKDIISRSVIKLKGSGEITIEATRNLKSETQITAVKGSEKKEEVGNWTCEIKKYNAKVITQDAAILNPQFNKLYVGAMYKFEDIATGSFKTLPYLRKPLTLVTANTGAKKSQVLIQSPSSGNVQAGVSQLTAGAPPMGARTYGSLYEIHSEEEFFLKTGGSGYYLGFGGKHSFDFKSTKKSNKYILEVYQAYYTISVDNSIYEPKDFFILNTESQASHTIAEAKIDPNWVFVDSVTYGRMLYIIFESDYSFKESGIDGSIYAKYGLAGAQASLTERQKKILNSTKISVGAIGGKPAESAALSNVRTIDELHGKIDKYFKQTNDEDKIAFTLSTLDQAIVSSKMITTYTSRQCAPRASAYRVTLDYVENTVMDDPGEHSELSFWVQIHAFGGKGNFIVDNDKINNPYLPFSIMPESLRKSMRLPVTFGFGSEKHQIYLKQDDKYYVEKSILFNIPIDDPNAKLQFSASAIEYDDTSKNDYYDTPFREVKIKDISESLEIKLLARDEAAKLTFCFTIQPVYED